MLHLTWKLGMAVLAGIALSAVFFVRKNHGRRRSRALLGLSALLLFLCLGAGRALSAVRKLEGIENQIVNLAGESVQVKGRIKALGGKDGKVEITLEGCRISGTSLTDGAESELGMPMDILVSFRQPPFSYDAGDTVNGAETYKDREILRIGRTVRISGYLKTVARARNPGEFDYGSYYASLGTGCRMDGIRILDADTDYARLPDSLYRLRAAGTQILERIAEEEDAGIYEAAVLGDKTELDPDIRALFQRNGIAHLLAISGLHLSIVGMGLYRLMRKTGMGFWTAGIMGGLFVAAYGVMTGGSASIVRAAVMMTAGFLASCLGRTYDLLSAMSLAAVCLLWKYPYLAGQGGFQLSFGAIGAIGVAAPVIRGWMAAEERVKESGEEENGSQKVVKGMYEGFIISLSIQLITFPIILYHFFQFPLYGVLLNLIVIPLMGVVVCSGIAGIILGAISLLAGMAALGPGHYVLAFYRSLCQWVSALPGSNIVMGRPSLPRIMLYYAGLAVILGWMAWRTGRWKKEESEEDKNNSAIKYNDESVGNVSRKGFTGRLMSRVMHHNLSQRPPLLFRSFIISGICLLSYMVFQPLPISGLRVLWMDVGQGDGCVIRTGAHVVLIDGGSSSEKNLGKNRLESCLKSYGISRIDYIFVSHGDIDHINGLIYLLESGRDISIGRLVVPCLSQEDEGIGKLKQLAEDRGIPVAEAAAGDSFPAGQAAITCLYPGREDHAGNANEESAVLKVDYKDCHILFTGDMSSEGERAVLERFAGQEGHGPEGYLEEIQILKTAHHGSRYSTCEEWLDGLGLLYAVISYKEGNSYGHPHKEVMERFDKKQIKLWETAKSGAVELYTDGDYGLWKPFLLH